MKHNKEQQDGFLQRLRQRFTKKQSTEERSQGTFVDDLNAAESTADQTTPMSRVARKQAHEQEFNQAKTIHPDMRRRLNWAIGIVALLIVVVYLVLFFV